MKGKSIKILEDNIEEYSYNHKQSNTYIRKNRLQNKDCNKRQKRTLHNQGINPRRRYNSCKYLCTQHRSSSIHKVNANSHERGNQQ